MENEPHPTWGKYIRDIVFGANDGVVTALGFLVGITQTSVESQFILIAGIVVIIAGAASMALGNFLAVRSAKQFYLAELERENWEIDNLREKEIEEIRDIYKNMGFSGEELQLLVKKVTSNRELWLKVMMRDELGLIEEENKKPIWNGLIIGSAYIIAGTPALLPFLIFQNVGSALIWASFISLLVMFGIGIVRSLLNKTKIWTSGIEVIIIGILASLIGFIAGKLTGFIV